MPGRINIALTVPSSGNKERYIYLRIKKELSNEPCEFSRPVKLLAVSDIEGNFLAFRRLLIKNGVIDTKYRWTFGEGHLVIAGDCFDRGDQVTECLWLIYSLEEKAQREGGYVHFLLGNHEIMNLNGDWRYVHPKYASVARPDEPLTALYDGSNEIWRWLRTKNIIEKIGDILFVHAGIAGELLNLRVSLPEINNRARPHYIHASHFFADPVLSAVFNTESSPFWYRGYYLPGMNETLLNDTLDWFRVNTIVTGHTMVEKITPYFNNRLINIDTDHAAGKSEALLVLKDRYYRVDSEGNREKIA